jgi:hypothetical protein
MGLGARRGRLAACAVLGASLAFAVFIARLGSSSSASPLELGAQTLPGPARPAFLIPEPSRLLVTRPLARSATVIRAVPVRRAPRADASAIARLETRTPERTANVVLVVGSEVDRSGRLWSAVRVPALPRNRTGWVPRDALGASRFLETRLVIDLRRLTATLYSGGRRIFGARVGVGKRSSPTPRGEFYVRSKVISFRNSFYGPLAFGTSARSSVLTDWPAGGFIGIHGTNRPELLPGRVSHGCIRMRNEDIVELGRLLPVGTPVTIRSS